MGPEAYGIGSVALAVIAILMVFVRSLVKRQDAIVQAANESQERMFSWFTTTMNGTLTGLKDALNNNRHAMEHNQIAMEHNTKNLKTMQELSTNILQTIVEKDQATAAAIIESDAATAARIEKALEANGQLVLSKLEELLTRDRSQTREPGANKEVDK